MSKAFNQIAKDYDADFVHSAIGSMQRKIVWDYLEKAIAKIENLHILELNCGTGEDAVWLASKGHHVVATDISKEMLNVARSKVSSADLDKKVTFSLLDISKFETYPTDKKFDLIFSNFGGFNCVNPQTFSNALLNLSKFLRPNGRLILVIMPKICFWESIYFTLKGKFSMALRRNRNDSLEVAVGDEMVKTWYHSPKQIKRLSRNNFNIIRILPAGFLIPPSYLEAFFSKHLKTLQFLNRLDKLFRNFSCTASISDHFIIDMEVKS